MTRIANTTSWMRLADAQAHIRWLNYEAPLQDEGELEFLDHVCCSMCNDGGYYLTGPVNDRYRVTECGCGQSEENPYSLGSMYDEVGIDMRDFLDIEECDHLLGISHTDEPSPEEEEAPRLSESSRRELDGLVAAIRDKLAQDDEELAKRRDYEGDESARELAVTGYWDVWYQEWSPSETQGVPVDGFERLPLHTDQLRVSPYRVLDGIEFLFYSHFLTKTLSFQGRLGWRFTKGFLNLAQRSFERAIYPAKGYRDSEVVYTSKDADAETLAWLHRDRQLSDKAICSRWNRPEDELAFMEEIREAGREGEWYELMADFRRRKLENVLVQYFGIDPAEEDVWQKSIVLKWENRGSQSKPRWYPALQMKVEDWVRQTCEDASIVVTEDGGDVRVEQRGGSVLGGLQSCILSIQRKAALKKKRLSMDVGREEAWPTMKDVFQLSM